MIIKNYFSIFFLYLFTMGRKCKYITLSEKIEARKVHQMKYYWKNQEKIKQKNLKRYHETKDDI
jgi:hypothetical protein